MNALSLKALRKTYASGVVAVDGIDLGVAAGDFFALLGPNGAGKSTTIGIISSLVRKTSGQVEVFGLDLDRDREEAKRCLGLVPQEVNFNQFDTPLNIVANQAGYYGLRRRQALSRAEECLEQLSLWDRRHSPSRQLSGGMKRRLMIARALAHRPRLLILDEPTAGVDIEIRRSMWDFLQRLNAEGTTIILTTHYLEEAEKLCRNVAIINRGKIVESGDMRGLLSRMGMARYIAESRQPLAELPAIADFHLQRVDDSSFAVEVPAALGIHRLFSELGEHGIEVVSVRNAANRLEQVFLGLVDAQSQTGGGASP